MVVFTYDGGFEGFLTCIYEGYYKTKPNKIIKHKDYIENFLEENIYIETNKEKWEKVYSAIEKNLGSNILKKVYSVYLSGEYEVETTIFFYIVLAFKVGPKIDLYKHNPYVNKIDKIESRVYSEAHRFKGFIRFKDINGILYSKIDTDNNILEFIIGHFINRFSNERFIIHDEKRDSAIIYNGEKGKIVINANLMIKDIENIENDVYEKLWREYFKSTTITERLNKRLQRQMMPKKYWKNIIETKENI